MVVDVRDLPTDLAIELGYFGNGFLSRWMRGIEYFVYRRADLIITVSQGMRRLLADGGIAAERIHVAPIGYDAIDAPAAANQAHRVLAAIPPEAFVVLYSGTMGYVVDVMTILRAASLTREHRNVLYLFVGDGQRLEEYQAFSRAEGTNCLFVGRVSKASIGAICARAAVCVYPLIDGRVIATLLGNKIFDYLGAGRPTLYCGPPGDVSELIELAGCGICLAAGDAPALAAAILELQAHPERAAAMGRAGYHYVMQGLTARETTAGAARRILQLRVST